MVVRLEVGTFDDLRVNDLEAEIAQRVVDPCHVVGVRPNGFDLNVIRAIEDLVNRDDSFDLPGLSGEAHTFGIWGTAYEENMQLEAGLVVIDNGMITPENVPFFEILDAIANGAGRNTNPVAHLSGGYPTGIVLKQVKDRLVRVVKRHVRFNYLI